MIASRIAFIEKFTYNWTIISIYCFNCSECCHCWTRDWIKKKSRLSYCVYFYAVIIFIHVICLQSFRPNSKPTLWAHWALAVSRGRRAASTNTDQHTFTTARTHLVGSHRDYCCVYGTHPRSACGSFDLFLFPFRTPSWCSPTSGGRSPQRWDLSAMPLSSMRR